MTKHILAVDGGTTSVRTLLLTDKYDIVDTAQKEVTQHYPHSGWIEHDPEELVSFQLETMRAVLRNNGIHPSDVHAVSITNQRETALVWDRHTGEPIYNAIVWASRQSNGIIEQWREKGLDPIIREKTGLISDAYYSASKIAWILDHITGARERAERGELMAGTVDSWLIWNFTGRKRFVTDVSNASRTQMFNIHTGDWDDELLAAYGIPRRILAEVLPSDAEFGNLESTFGSPIPIASVMGDQQAGLFGQACFSKGQTKMSYGTSGVLVMNTGGTPRLVDGVTASTAWQAKGETTYDIEGVVFSMGKTMQWLRDDMKLIHHATDSEWYGGQVSSTHGVYLVPAFTGLAAPHWDPYARANIVGMSNATTRLHIIRAAVESMAYQTRDLVDATQTDKDIRIPELRVDGGAVNNNMLCQLQADVLGIPVIRPRDTEATALGAAWLAGLSTGLLGGLDEISSLWTVDRVFEPQISDDQREEMYHGWRLAVDSAKGWAREVSSV
ncbi:glycerol kinase GlpK [Flaviflexus equikiangi]|uniref:ATP:glycerol 3-phosphotransferase n=1 Tax=Flaviflexus equikiangi TaxID=2758573 RepID=A0ABS2TGY3_9ACTO|nr:glycerol kinase GlpK [Flaviflexus equikiangi]MBM9433582.1 glycerol kinase GlpK [Flaviflexus equikiangi]